MATKYPNQVDTNTEIPLSTDNVTPIRAIVTNTLRGAILAIEAELGVQPSGTYGTIKSRLEDLDSKITTLQGGIVESGTIEIQSGGSTLTTSASILNFVNATLELTSPGEVKVTIPGGSSGVGTLAEVLVEGSVTGGHNITFSSGDHLILSTTSHIQSQGSLIEFDDSISVTGNATISGVIDGINGTRLDAQASIPIAVSSGKGVLWERSSDKKLVFTDDTSTDWVLNPASASWSTVLGINADSGSTSPRITSGATLLFQQRAAGIGALPAHGSLWVKNTSPTTIIFTNSDGTDFDLATSSGSSLTAPTNPTDNNRIAFGINGDLDYAASLTTDGTYLGIGSGTLPTSGDVRSPNGFIWKTRTSGGQTRNLFDYGATSTDVFSIGHSSYDVSLNAASSITLKADSGVAAIFSSETTASLATATGGYVLALNDDKTSLEYKFVSGVSIPTLTNVLASGNTTDGYDIVLSIGDAISSEDGYVTIAGGLIINGILDMNANRITEVPSPLIGTDAVNKNYVDISAPRPTTPHDDGYFLKSVSGTATWAEINSSGGSPTGAAGGDLSGTYPNPTVSDLTITSEQTGSVLYFNGTNWVQLSPSTDGYVLTTHSTSQNPTWTPPTRNTLGVLPADITKAPALSGSSVFAAKEDHKHNISTAAAVSIGASNAEGTGTSLARSDHTHAVTNFNIASQQQGSVLYFNGSIWVSLDPSSDGYVLSTHSTSQNPTWDTSVSSILSYSSASTTLTINDVNKYLRLTNVTPTLTVPTNASVPIPINTIVSGVATAAALTITPASGVQINKAAGLSSATRAAYSPFSLKKVGPNEWDLTGDLGIT